MGKNKDNLMSKKDTFLLYKNHYNSFYDLDDDVVGRVFKAVFSYTNNLEYEIDKKSVEFGIYKAIKTQIDYSTEHYLETCKTNSKNANIRWGKEKSKKNNATAYEKCERMHNDNDSDNENESESESGSDSSINSNFSTFPFSNENKKDCVREEQEQQNDNVVYFSDFEGTPVEWNTPTTTPKEYQVREFNQEETNVFFTEIKKIFKNDFLPEHIQNGVFHQILEYIIGELEEQKAKGKYIDKDDAETLLRFIRQKKKPEQKQRFIKDFVQQYPEYNPNNEIETVF